MFKDKEEALRRLEVELLRDEEVPEEEPTADWEEESDQWDDGSEEWNEEESEDWTDQPEEWETEADRHRDFRAYNADRPDLDLDSFSRQVYDTERKVRGRWAAAAALAVLAGLLLVLAFLAARYLGR